MEWEKHTSKFMDRLTDVLAGAFGAGVYHFLTDKKNPDGTPVLDKDNKPVQTLDMKQVRGHAPHFAKTMMDEAEFIALKNELDPALRKSLESWMPNLGIHQRADIVLTLAEMTYREDLATSDLENRQKARETAVVALKQLAELPDDTTKHAHAVTFKFMKANETDYLGSQLTAQASAAIVAAVAEFNRAKQEWDKWADGRSIRVRRWRRRLNARQQARTATTLLRWLTSFYRVFQLPTE